MIRIFIIISIWIFGVSRMLAETAPVTVTFSTSSVWATGFTGNVTITNQSDATISGWTIAFDLPVPGFSKVWNVTENGSTETRKVFTNIATNVNIHPGASRTFGFNALGSFTVGASNFTFNGLIPSGNIPALGINNISENEGNFESDRVLEVYLSSASTEWVTVEWATSDGSARAGEDYVAASGKITFAPGEIRQEVTVRILGDVVEEPDESFNVSLSGASGAPITKSTALSTLLNDDFTPGFSIGNSSVIEGDEGVERFAVFNVTLAPASATVASIDFMTQSGTALESADFQPVSGRLTFNPGETSKSIEVRIVSDGTAEAPEFFSMVLSNPVDARLRNSQAIARIYDNDGGGAGGKPQTGTYNYAEVLQKSLWFYDAQRSGKLPDDFRVRWRANSALADGSDAGLDLTGGFYDAGDHVKFGLPMAYSLTMLAWGGLEYDQAYTETRQKSHLMEILKWGADYLMRCHVRDVAGNTTAFYGQLGNGEADHAYWGRAEFMNMPRPAYKIDAANPGSDLAAETAATLAATALVFQESEPEYAAELLEHATALYRFADTYRGKYSDSIPDAAQFYKSWSGYQDELVWGAIWLYRASGDPTYLQKAKLEYNLLSSGGAGNHPYQWALSWDDKSFGCYILMAIIDGGVVYRTDAERWLNYWTVGVNGQSVPKTPGGLAWRDQWGALRYAANTAFCALVYADRVQNPGNRYTDFARAQIDYALGSNPAGRSYVCGFGNQPPVNPHHRNAHASLVNQIGIPASNRHVLFGALVGGPDFSDAYVDDRSDYVRNEVAMDYNAGFTGAVVRLYQEFGGYVLPESSPAAPAERLLHATFDDFPLGTKSDDEWKALWPNTSWANGPDDGRLAVNDQIAYAGTGRSVRILYPKGGKQSNGSGAQWFADIGGVAEDLYFSYWVRFDEDFDFVLGGKLPGLGGAVSWGDRTHEWSGRLMWRDEGKAEFYLHTPAGNDYNPGTRFWWNTEGPQARFIPGRWHHIEMHYRLNTPGQFDGLMEGWFDGVKFASYPAFYFRDAPTASSKIAWVFFSTFFGGSSSSIWEATKDEYATFDEFIVSNARIGYPGMPLDIDADGLPNDWELEHFDDDMMGDVHDDSDGDKQPNLAEFIAGTNPRDAGDLFKSIAVMHSDDRLSIEVDGKRGRRYQLQRSTNLLTWEDVLEHAPLELDTGVNFQQRIAGPRYFYRVGVSLP